MKRARREADRPLESVPDPDPEIGDEAEVRRDTAAIDIGIDRLPLRKMRKRQSAADRDAENAVDAARKKETTVMIPAREKRPSMKEKQTSIKIDQDQLRLPVLNARATGVAETKTSIVNASETVIASTDLPTNTAQATALIETTGPEAETAIETVSEIVSAAIATVDADLKPLRRSRRK